MRLWTASMAMAAGLLVPGLLLAAPAQVPTYFGLQPGVTGKAEVDLQLGEPLQRLGDGVYAYAPPATVTDTERVVGTFFADTKRLARLDVYLKDPLAPEALRPSFGTRVMLRDRPEGGQEEIFYPKLHALVYGTKAAGAPVAAIAYLSPRLLVDVYVDRFNQLMRDKQTDEACTDADKAVVIDPDYARGYVAQGLCFEAQSQTEEAIVRYIAGTNARYTPKAKGLAHARLGALYWKGKNWMDKAEAEMKRAVEIAPDLAEAHYLFGAFLRQLKRGDEALPRLEKAVAVDPAHVAARLELADLLYDQSAWAKARLHYEALTTWAASGAAETASRKLVYFRHGWTLAKENQHERALEFYRKVLEIDPRDVASLNNIAWGYQALRQYQEAMESCRQGLAISPRDFHLNRNMANALLELGRPEEAMPYAEAALAAKPGDAWQMFYIARTWAAQGKKKQALEWLQKAVAAGFRDRQELVSDRFLQPLQKNGDFKKVLASLG